jgi:hypothetical protein
MRPQENNALARVVFNRRAVEDDNNIGGRFEQCQFHHISAAGVFFTRPMYDNNKTIWGPAPWTWPAAGVTGATAVSTFGTHTHVTPVPTNGPVAGDLLLVVFVAVPNGGLRPWVLGWSAT